MSRVGLVFDDGCQLHEPPERFRGKATMEHAERPERTQVIWEAVTKAALDKQCERVPAREATRDEALMCHTCEHVDALQDLEHEAPAARRLWKGVSAGGTGWMSGADMYYNSATPRAARLAAGGVLALTERVCNGTLDKGFAIVRPPGHHACSDVMCGVAAGPESALGPGSTAPTYRAPLVPGRAQAAPAHPRAPPHSLGSEQLASGRPKAEGFARAPSRLLLSQLGGDRRAQRAAAQAARGEARAHRRLGRAPRQRHAEDLRGGG